MVTNSPSILSATSRYDLWDLNYLKQTTQEYIEKARAESVDSHLLDSLISKIEYVVSDAEFLKNPVTGRLSAVAMHQQVFHQCLYCNDLIRQILLTKVKRLAQQGLNDPSLNSQHDLINGCVSFVEAQLAKNLPRPFQMPQVTESDCRDLWNRVEGMQANIIRRAENYTRNHREFSNSDQRACNG